MVPNVKSASRNYVGGYLIPVGKIEEGGYKFKPVIFLVRSPKADQTFSVLPTGICHMEGPETDDLGNDACVEIEQYLGTSEQ